MSGAENFDEKGIFIRRLIFLYFIFQFLPILSLSTFAENLDCPLIDKNNVSNEGSQLM
jgi:hypothetical protein